MSLIFNLGFAIVAVCLIFIVGRIKNYKLVASVLFALNIIFLLLPPSVYLGQAPGAGAFVFIALWPAIYFFLFLIQIIYLTIKRPFKYNLAFSGLIVVVNLVGLYLFFK
jgi:hypothetical protein